MPEGCDKKSMSGGGRIAGGVAVFLVLQYASSIWKLVTRTGGMDSKFSQVAVDEYRWFLLKQNLWVILAYLVVGVVAWVVLMPLLSRWARLWSGKARWRLLAVATASCYLMHSYFMFRLAGARPYFINDAALGGWYYSLLELPPDSWRPAIHLVLFQLPIVVVLGAAAVGWWRWGKRAGKIVMAVAVVGLGACWLGPRALENGLVEATSPVEGDPLNVIVIGSDSLRGDRMGYTGYRPERKDGPAAAGVSPHIDDWAKDASVFKLCRTPIGSTLESGISTMTSTYPHTHGVRHMFPPEGDLEQMRERTIPLAAILAREGYDTAAVGDWCAGYFEVTPLGFDDVRVSSFDNFRIYMSQVVLMAHFVVPLYFDNELGYRLFPQIRSFAQFVTPEVVTERVKSMIARQATSGRPFFWNVFYSCNHLPFRSADPYNRMFADPDYEGPNATGVDFDVDEFIGGTDLEDKWAALPEREVQQIRALYDGCTRQFDRCFAEILQSLEHHGLLENTVVVLTADHGDDLYEPGVTLGHGLGFQGGDASFHVPLAIRIPGREGQVFKEQVRTLDLVPTLAEILGVEAPDCWEGRSLVRWLEDSSEAHDRPFYGETPFPFIQFRVDGVERPKLPPMDEMTFVDAEFNHQFVLKPEFSSALVAAKQRCLRTGSWKLVCTPTVTGARSFQLFHTASDPNCRENLAAERPEVLEAMRAALERWMDEREEMEIPEIFPNGEPSHEG
ncbi:MAG: sulfatase family protein [Verrucomicrobiales bacterium]